MKSCFFALAGVLLTTSALADGATTPRSIRPLPSPGHWFISPDIGFDTTLYGQFVNKVEQTNAVATTIFGQSTAAGVSTHMGAQSFHSLFDTPYHAGIEAGYDFNDTNEAALGLRWVHADAKNFDAMTLTGPAGSTFAGKTIGGGMALKGKFSDYSEIGVDGVYRHYLSGFGKLHPYLAGSTGLKYNPDIKLTLTGSGIDLPGLAFYDAGWVWEAGAAIGFRWDLSEQVTFGLEAQVHYASPLDRNMSYSTTSNTLMGFNRGGQRVDMPLSMAVAVRF